MVDLTNQVVILDEAHNMEDSAREAASLSVTSMQVADVADEIEEVCKGLQSLLTGTYGWEGGGGGGGEECFSIW